MGQVIKLSYHRRYFTKNSEGGKIEQSPKLTIWTGANKHEITAICEPEIEWLAYELSEWLRLPIDLVD